MPGRKASICQADQSGVSPVSQEVYKVFDVRPQGLENAWKLIKVRECSKVRQG